MEFESSNVYSPCLYKTAPNSPNGYSRSTTMEYYYSAPVSPRRATFKTGDDDDDDQGSGFDEFEFETSKRYQSEASESPVSGDGGRRGRGKHRERGDSLPAMAFADELFLNGLVMPLKPPPGLHSDSEFSSFGRRSPLASPKSPRTVCRIPFARKSSWNDDFDPFVAALEKVREEKRGRNSHHRRSRSYSPFRAMSKKSSGESNDFSNGNSLAEPMPSPSYSGPLDFKGSAYARWVRDQTRHGLSTKSSRRFMAVVKAVQYKPSIAFCLGYGLGSPIKAK